MDVHLTTVRYRTAWSHAVLVQGHESEACKCCCFDGKGFMSTMTAGKRGLCLFAAQVVTANGKLSPAYERRKPATQEAQKLHAQIHPDTT